MGVSSRHGAGGGPGASVGAMTTVTVVITTYSRPDMVLEALRSVLDQSLPPDEVIIVDDGSPEPLNLDLDDLGVPVRILRQENRGLAAARNAGAAEATTDIVMFLDDDDLYAADRVRHAVAAHRDADVVCCGQRGFDDGAAVDLRPSNRIVSTHEEQASSLLDQITPNFGATSVRRSVWVPLDESYPASQDIEWWIRRAQERARVLVIESQDLAIRRHSGQRHLNGSPARIEASWRLLEEHAAFFESHRRAKAFRLARISMMERGQGRRADAVRSAVRSISVRPTRSGVGALASALLRR